MSYTIKTQNFNLTQEQKRLAKELGISETFMRLLIGRGFKDEQLKAYLYPSVSDMSSPYDIGGMDRAVARVREAIDKGEKILIYGDYDCDGICAVSILMLYLRDKADVAYFIPDRNRDGYGVSVSALDRIIASRQPNLIITVDCGITAAEEIKYLGLKGIDTIVTDHHEPQDCVPNCIVVDPKLNCKGFREYCGAGVALKLVEAMAGVDEACKYLDIAAIATIADVVPLKDDNRIIAYYGLKQIRKTTRKGLKFLLGDDEVNSQNVMFRLAPRINAAGRLNSAMKVVDLFLDDDYFMLKTLANELIRDNLKRQELCETVVADAKRMLKGVDFARTGIIALYSENWEAGVLGIAASKLVEEFKRPAVLFAKDGDKLKGSARRVPSINIFELFCKLSGYFTSFGGHAQAAGVSIELGNLEQFKKEADRLILQEHSLSEFIPDTDCEMKLPTDFNFLGFAKELELMQPVGYGNSRPHFLIEADGLRFDRIGYSKHVKCALPNLDIVGFYNYGEALAAKTGKICYDVALDINCFRNNVTAQGILRSIEFKEILLTADEADCLNMHHLDYTGSAYISRVSIDNIDKKIELSPFGTVIVCFSQSDYESLCDGSELIRGLPVFVGNVAELNPKNCVVVCPCKEFDFGYYDEVVVAGAPLTEGYIAYLAANARHCCAITDCTAKPIAVSDDELRNIYKALAQIAAGKAKASNPRALYIQVNDRYKTSESKLALALKIFGQLGLADIGERGELLITRKSVALENSQAYRNIEHFKN